MPSAICPECHEEVYVDPDSEQGTEISCDECSARLIVVGLDPIELDLNEGSEDDRAAGSEFDDFEYDDSRY
jgi:DNA-directed RNA polymerase subunit RPC12/RpoP